MSDLSRDKNVLGRIFIEKKKKKRRRSGAGGHGARCASGARCLSSSPPPPLLHAHTLLPPPQTHSRKSSAASAAHTASSWRHPADPRAMPRADLTRAYSASAGAGSATRASTRPSHNHIANTRGRSSRSRLGCCWRASRFRGGVPLPDQASGHERAGRQPRLWLRCARRARVHTGLLPLTARILCSQGATANAGDLAWGQDTLHGSDTCSWG